MVLPPYVPEENENRSGASDAALSALQGAVDAATAFNTFREQVEAVTLEVEAIRLRAIQSFIEAAAREKAKLLQEVRQEATDTAARVAAEQISGWANTYRPSQANSASPYNQGLMASNTTQP